jgi:glycosyltransferase involved in cell wall biosynthesis
MKIIYLTAGAAGMYCGSCMHDNSLAKALASLGHDVQLIPLYTPILTDETSVASSRIFFVGINVYLQQNLPLFRHLPRWLTSSLDQPWLLKWASQRSVKIKGQELGALTVSMLQGSAGNQRQEVERLVDWIADEKPDVVVFTNMLVAGCAAELKARVGCKLVVTLQGDDIFLQDLLPEFRTPALAEIRRIGSVVDQFLTNSLYYADFMADYLQLPRERFRIVPLGLETREFETLPPVDATPRPPAIGYLARLAPEKGLHVLTEAFRQLRSMPDCGEVRLKIAGWLGKMNQPYVDEHFATLRNAGLADAFEYIPDLDRRGKLNFLRSLDILSVPTTYREPKGLYVLESLAAGVPVVQPAHGAFPELLHDLPGGLLVPPNDPQALAEALAELIRDPKRRRELGEQGRQAVLSERNARKMAEQTAAVWTELLDNV